MSKIKRLPIDNFWYSENKTMVNKVNELIDAYNGEESRVLICPHCGSEEWLSTCSSTLMGGPVNYYTYTCAKCSKQTKVRRVEGNGDPRVYLGPEDEVQ